MKNAQFVQLAFKEVIKHFTSVANNLQSVLQVDVFVQFSQN